MCLQALQKWGWWDALGSDLSNGQAVVNLEQLQFTRPADVARNYRANEGVTGLIQVLPSCATSRSAVWELPCMQLARAQLPGAATQLRHGQDMQS